MRFMDISDQLFEYLLGNWQCLLTRSASSFRTYGTDPVCEAELNDLRERLRRWFLIDDTLRQIGLEPVDAFHDEFPNEDLYEDSDTWGAEALLGHT